MYGHFRVVSNLRGLGAGGWSRARPRTPWRTLPFRKKTKTGSLKLANRRWSPTSSPGTRSLFNLHQDSLSLGHCAEQSPPIAGYPLKVLELYEMQSSLGGSEADGYPSRRWTNGTQTDATMVRLDLFFCLTMVRTTRGHQFSNSFILSLTLCLCCKYMFVFLRPDSDSLTIGDSHFRLAVEQDSAAVTITRFRKWRM